MDIVPMTADEVARLRELLAEAWAADAVLVEAIRWSGPGATHRKLTFHAPQSPTLRIWLLRSGSDAERPAIETRPVTPEEMDALLASLRELGFGGDIHVPIAEAHAHPRDSTFELSFDALERMIEGTLYRRWYFRFHGDAPPSVAYILETRRGNAFKTCPGGRRIRGPW